MTQAMDRFSGSSRQRGFWLRCFLGGVLLAIAAAGINAQVMEPSPFRVSHFQGVVVAPDGKPVSGADVVLQQDEKTIASTTTDNGGHFRINHIAGKFRMRMHVPHYSIVNREVVVRFELATDFKRNMLYVILGPGQCSDDCSTVFTDKKDFERTIRRNTHHNR